MNLTHHRINSKCVLARFTESEILDILTRAVAAEAGIDLNDPAVEVRTRDLARALPSADHTFEAVIDINIDMSEPESSTAASEADAAAALDYLKGAICKPILADDLITGIKINGVHEVPWKMASNGYAYMDFGSLDISAVSDRRKMFVDHQNIPHTIRSVATLEDGRPQWEISKDGTIRVGNTTHLPDGTIRQEGPYPFTIGPL